jgi:hypothetical protein
MGDSPSELDSRWVCGTRGREEMVGRGEGDSDSEAEESRWIKMGRAGETGDLMSPSEVSTWRSFERMKSRTESSESMRRTTGLAADWSDGREGMSETSEW